MFRHVGLHINVPGPLAAAGPTRDLLQLLVGPLTRPEIAAPEAEIRIDDSDAGQIWKMVSLGDDLGTDNDIHLARFDPADELARCLGAKYRIAGHDQELRLRKQGSYFLFKPFNARTTGHELAFDPASRAFLRHRNIISAMMTLELFAVTVLYQPG